jgi:hypothetical protein
MACRLAKPFSAVNGHIRFVTVNDVYELDNYPRYAAAIKELKAAAQEGSKVVSALPGDFLSPCTSTTLDQGKTMMKAVNKAGVDYVMFGNHEFDLVPAVLQKRIKEYKGVFTYADLVREFPYSTDIAIIQLPGEVIEETIKSSRTSGDGEKPFFLHVNKECIISKDCKIEMVDGKPFDPEKLYTCATLQLLLTGMGQLQPMYDYVKRTGTCPSLEICHPIKDCVMETCMKSAWRNMLGMAGWDVNHAENVSSEELHAIIDKTLDRLDRDKSGFLDPNEIEDLVNESFIASPVKKRQRISERTSQTLVAHLIKSLDTNVDGRIGRNEFHNLVWDGSVEHKDEG